RRGLAAEARALAERAKRIAANEDATKPSRPRTRPERRPTSDRPLAGTTCAITGPTHGIGRTTALWLAERGARGLMLCRNRDKASEVLRELRSRGGDGEVVHADLASLASVAGAAARVRELAPELDVLINNAGVLNFKRRLSADGIEESFAVNFLAHYLL